MKFKEFLSKNTFLNENYNTATSMMIPIETSSVKTSFEIITEKQFNLFSYIRSFNNSKAKKEFGSSDFRSLIYAYSPGFVVFTFTVNVFHSTMASQLDKEKHKMKLPNISYFNEKIAVDRLSLGDKVSKNWCFPIIIEKDTIVTSIGIDALMTLNGSVNLKKVFMLSDEEWKSILHSCV